ncbi:hypothetical protein D3C76_1803860 [compost metagenome]
MFFPLTTISPILFAFNSFPLSLIILTLTFGIGLPTEPIFLIESTGSSAVILGEASV